MKQMLWTILIPMSLILWTGCSKKAEPPVNEIPVKEKLDSAGVNFSKVKEIPISDIHYPHMHLGESTLWVYGRLVEKNKKYRLKEYDHHLEPCRQIEFNYGEGPGDIGGGSYFYSTKKQNLCFDNILRRISIFDKNFKFIKFITLSKTPYLPIMFIENGTAFLGNRWWYDPKNRSEFIYFIHHVTFPDIKKKKIMTFGPFLAFNENKKRMFGNEPGFHYFYRGGKIYFLNMKTYQIHIMDKQGKILSRIRVEHQERRVPPELKKTWLIEQIGRSPANLARTVLVDEIQPASWMIPLEKGFVVVRRSSYSTSCQSPCEGDYFDYELNLVGKVTFPCFYRLFKMRFGYFPFYCFYKGGHLYLVNEYDEEFRLEKWKVQE